MCLRDIKHPSQLRSKRKYITTRKAAKFLASFIIFTLVVTYSLALLCHAETVAQNSSSTSLVQKDSFVPVIQKPMWVDQDNNGIADSFDEEIGCRKANGTAQEFVNVTVMLKAAPTVKDADAFSAANGFLTTSPWTRATCGFGGTIAYDDVAVFAEQCYNLLLVEKEALGEANIAYAARQVGARTYVWNTMGLQGDPAASTAVVDTGIDGYHVDFSPGYGDRDFSKKIVGWNDLVGSNTFPIDDNGHGSHVAGLAAGNGFFSTDASGNAVATWGSDLGGVDSTGTYLVSGVMVSKTGMITVNVRWARTGTASLSALRLYYGDKAITTASWAQVAAVSTSNQNTVYSLSYNVASTLTGGYDKYQVALVLTAGTGDLYVSFSISWPYTPPSDGFEAWTGIAPQSKLVGVKILDSTGQGTTSNMIDAIEWLISNRMTYHITVVSMSLGYGSEVAVVDSAILNLVNSGVTVVVAAGNSGSGSNSVYTCGSVDEVITVAALNQFDNVASYSSQGGISRYTGRTTKPDIAAPGGSVFAVPLLSVDTNNNDAENYFAETQIDDSAPMMGTSMATPIISGCAQVVIQAIGGYAAWNWTRDQALRPKMILLMTASDTYPNLREGGTSSTSPILNRGGKDVHEGYGRVNLDAAVDAVLKSYTVGTVTTDTLGMPPTTADISVLGQRLVWARNVQLIAGSNYSFSLTVPAGADYDLYMYDSAGTAYGEPQILATSTNATTGGIEQFWVSAPYSGTYYIVVKRATETTGSGVFTLGSSSLSSTTVRLNTPGLSSALNVVHYTQNNATKTESIVAGTFSDFADTGTTLTIDNPIYVSATQRYITADQTTFTAQSGATFTVNFKTQYFIAVNSAHGFATASQWIDQGSSFTASVTSPTETLTNTHRLVCTGFSVDGSAQAGGTSVTFLSAAAAQTVEFFWTEQFYLTVNSAHSSIGGSGWYNAGDTANAALSSGTVAGETGVRYVFTSWSGDASGTKLTSNSIIMNGAKTATANWKTQNYLTTSANFGTVSPESGWYDAGSTVTVSATAPEAVTGERYVWTGWTSSGDGNFTGSDGQATVTLNEAVSESASWIRQYYLTVTSVYGPPSPARGWFDAGTAINASVSSSVEGIIVTEFTCKGWSGTGSVPTNGTANNVFFTLNQPSGITWNWEMRVLPAPLLAMILIVALTSSAVFLLRRRHKNQSANAPSLSQAWTCFCSKNFVFMTF